MESSVEPVAHPQVAEPSRRAKWVKRIIFVIGILTILHYLFDVIPAPIGTPGYYESGYVSCSDLGDFYLQGHSGTVAHLRVYLAEFGCSDDEGTP